MWTNKTQSTWRIHVQSFDNTSSSFEKWAATSRRHSPLHKRVGKHKTLQENAARTLVLDTPCCCASMCGSWAPIRMAKEKLHLWLAGPALPWVVARRLIRGLCSSSVFLSTKKKKKTWQGAGRGGVKRACDEREKKKNTLRDNWCCEGLCIWCALVWLMCVSAAARPENSLLPSEMRLTKRLS